ncbi:uncharacterized protein SAMN02745687_01369 [Lachnospiraceae bacterium NK3A20]|nr:uncharacterized protein SAMN02745687_01369 [Lachnospiraceae bacterium NK3A20]
MGVAAAGNIMNVLGMYGMNIMNSDEFRNAFQQVHHNVTTVGDHSLNVAVSALCICAFLSKLHINTKQKELTQAALCHDLGILGRYEKFENNRVCCRQHPVDSVDVAKKLVPDMDERTQKMIRTHMWPATPLNIPTSREGLIISLADKYCAIREVTTRRPGGYHAEHIMMRAERVKASAAANL